MITLADLLFTLIVAGVGLAAACTYAVVSMRVDGWPWRTILGLRGER